jgi:hypothetical protein|tara:strand:+ start:257 stop:496 length:240 start_codon:yes stop_codon:yes gene_type:complete
VQDKGARVTAVDIDLLVFPFVEMLSDLNQVEVNPVTAGFAQVGEELLTDVDLLIGADICFRPPMVRGGSRRSRGYLADR